MGERSEKGRFEVPSEPLKLLAGSGSSGGVHRPFAHRRRLGVRGSLGRDFWQFGLRSVILATVKVGCLHSGQSCRFLPPPPFLRLHPRP